MVHDGKNWCRVKVASVVRGGASQCNAALWKQCLYWSDEVCDGIYEVGQTLMCNTNRGASQSRSRVEYVTAVSAHSCKFHHKREKRGAVFTLLLVASSSVRHVQHIDWMCNATVSVALMCKAKSLL